MLYWLRHRLNAVAGFGCPKLPSHISRWESAPVQLLKVKKNPPTLEGAGLWSPLTVTVTGNTAFWGAQQLLAPATKPIAAWENVAPTSLCGSAHVLWKFVVWIKGASLLASTSAGNKHCMQSRLDGCSVWLPGIPGWGCPFRYLLMPVTKSAPVSPPSPAMLF